MPEQLSSWQQWFMQQLTESAPPDPAYLGQHLRVPDAHFLSQRMDIYRQGYQSRLRECITEDFPTLVALLGSQATEDLLQRFIDATPPAHSNINCYSSAFPGWCRQYSQLPEPMLELIDLEWAWYAALHQARITPLAPHAIEQLAAQGPAASIRLQPSLHILEHQWNSDAVFAAHQAEQELPPWLRDAHGLIIWRGHQGRRWQRQDIAALPVLRALQAGASLADSLAQATVDDPNTISAWFAQWMQLGLCVADAQTDSLSAPIDSTPSG